MMRKRTIIFISAIFLLALSSYIARDALTSACFQWYLKGYCRACLGGELAYDRIQHTDGGWVLDHPKLVTHIGVSDGGFNFSAEKAVIDMHVAWMARTFNLAISLDDPHIEIGPQAKELKRIFLQSCDDFRFFNLHFGFNIAKGSGILHQLGDDKQATTFNYRLVLDNQGISKGGAALWLSNGSELDPHFELLLKESPSQETQMQMTFRAFEGGGLDWSY